MFKGQWGPPWLGRSLRSLPSQVRNICYPLVTVRYNPGFRIKGTSQVRLAMLARPPLLLYLPWLLVKVSGLFWILGALPVMALHCCPCSCTAHAGVQCNSPMRHHPLLPILGEHCIPNFIRTGPSQRPRLMCWVCGRADGAGLGDLV